MCWVFWDAMFFCNFMLPKRRFWKTERTVPSAFSKHFSTIRGGGVRACVFAGAGAGAGACVCAWSRVCARACVCACVRVLTRLKSASKTHSERFVRSSKIFVWEG